MLLDALAPGNKAAWDKNLADTFVLTDETGKTITKKQLLEEMRPLPTGYSGNIQIGDFNARIYGDTAVVNHRDIEHEEIFGQKITAHYQTTDTWLRRNGKWQMIASQVFAVPSERTSITLPQQLLDSYTGEYELAPGVRYTVRLKDGRLIGQRTGRTEEELLAADTATFFPKGSTRGEKLFVRDNSGKVAKMLDRRDNNDIVWKRVP
jgi:hypothetical protein